jgi:Phage gp6-like head-tail connector protein
MVMFVSLQQASDHLRRDNTDDDADLSLKIRAASAGILNYLDTVDFLDSSGEVELDSNGDPINVPEEIQIATLMMIGVFYADRDAEDYRAGGSEDRLGKMPLPKAVQWLLDPLRQPRIG